MRDLTKGLAYNLTEEQARELARSYNMGASSEEAALRESEYLARNLYEEQLRKSGLYNDLNWKGEALERFREMFRPLLEDTEYHLELSGEKKQVIYDLKRGNEKGRVLGFKALQKEREKGEGKGRIRAFFDHETYMILKEAVGLPKNDLPGKTQDHVYITLEKLWDCICVITGKTYQL